MTNEPTSVADAPSQLERVRSNPIGPDDPRIVYLPEADVLAASGMCQVFRDRWFSVHPERGLMFWQSEKRRLGQLRGAAPWAETKFVPVVLVPIRLEDYQ